MRTIVLSILFLIFSGTQLFFYACFSYSAVSPEKKKPTIRYGQNGVPNFIKGENLSADLDRDPSFLKLKSQKQYVDIVFYYLDAQRELLRLNSARKEFVVRDVNEDANGQKHIHLAQVFGGTPVWAGELRVHLDNQNQVYYLHGSYRPIRDGFKPRAEIAKESAGHIALQTKEVPVRWKIQAIEAFVWAPDRGAPRLAQRVTLEKRNGDREFCFVDAVDGRILHRIYRTTAGRILGF